MAGNAVEEGLLSQIGNPAHSDAGRVVALAALVAGLSSGWAAWALLPGLAFFGAFAFGLLVAIGVAWVLGRRMAGRTMARRAAEMQARRDAESTAMDRALTRERSS